MEDGLKGMALDDLCRLAGSLHSVLSLTTRYLELLGLLPQAVSSKITVDYKRDETKLSSEFTAAISIANENKWELCGDP